MKEGGLEKHGQRAGAAAAHPAMSCEGKGCLACRPDSSPIPIPNPNPAASPRRTGLVFKSVPCALHTMPNQVLFFSPYPQPLLSSLLS